ATVLTGWTSSSRFARRGRALGQPMLASGRASVLVSTTLIGALRDCPGCALITACPGPAPADRAGRAPRAHQKRPAAPAFALTGGSGGCGTGRVAIGPIIERASRSTRRVRLPRLEGWGERAYVKNGPARGGPAPSR